MEPIRVLKEEHRAIERVLETLDRYAESQSVSSTPASQKDLLQIVEFIQQFADRIHHGKEEDIFFEQMIRAGFPRGVGPLAVMYHEHDQGRTFARRLKDLGEKDGPWSEDDRRHLRQAASGYTNLLRQHIYKEDNILYAMGASKLSPDAMDEMTEAFAKFEQSEEQSGEKRRLLSMAEALAERYATKAS